MPVVEIATWPLSDAYFSDPSIIDPAIEFLRHTEGCRSIYWGVSEGEIKNTFLFVEWETYEHHKAIIDRPGYPDFIGFLPSIAGGVNVKHVEFDKNQDPALTAPITEILLLNLKEGKTKSQLDNAVRTLADNIDEVNPKYAPATIGGTLESSTEYFAIVGWESLKFQADVFPEVAPLVMELQNNATTHISHASLKKAHPL